MVLYIYTTELGKTDGCDTEYRPAQNYAPLVSHNTLKLQYHIVLVIKNISGGYQKEVGPRKLCSFAATSSRDGNIRNSMLRVHGG